MTVKARDLRKLPASDLPDPTPTLIEGRLAIVPVDALDTDPHRGTLPPVSRAELHARDADKSSPMTSRSPRPQQSPPPPTGVHA